MPIFSDGLMKDFIRPEVLDGYSPKLETPCGSLYMTLNECGNKLCEIKVTMGKSGTCMNIMLQTIALLISVMLQSNINKDKIKKALLNQFEGSCGQVIWYKGEKFHSCIDFLVQKVLEDLSARGEIEIEEEETTT